MKKVIMLFTILIPIMSYAQASIRIDRPVLDGQARAISTVERDFAEGIYPREKDFNGVNFEVSMLIIKANTPQARKKLEIKDQIAIMIDICLDCKYEMYISEGKTVLLKLGNGTNMQFKTVGDIDKGYDATMLAKARGRFRNKIAIEVTRQQLQRLINGNVVKIRVIDDLTNKIDGEIKGNRLSLALKDMFNAIDNRLKNNDETEGF